MDFSPNSFIGRPATDPPHFVYCVVDEHNVVRETWVPGKGWES